MAKEKQKKKEKTAQEYLKEMTDVVEEKERKEEEIITEEAIKEFEAEERGEYKRETREERFAREEAEKLDKWVPKTDLGRRVRAGKIKNIDEIFESGEKILEPEIVDMLIPYLQKDTLFIGQAKGKFGGGKRRAFRQTQRKTKEGHVGIGYGRSAETLPAKEKAVRKAKLNLIKIKRGCASYDCSCDELHSIPFATYGKCSSVKINLMPAPQGTGLVVGDEMKKILRIAGIKDTYSKSFGRVKTTFNSAKACMQALDKLGSME